VAGSSPSQVNVSDGRVCGVGFQVGWALPVTCKQGKKAHNAMMKHVKYIIIATRMCESM
jgi:hypothetical protein